MADANGLQGTDTLKAAQGLTVPNKVTNVHNTATTFKPYDPGKAIGDTQPTLPDRNANYREGVCQPLQPWCRSGPGRHAIARLSHDAWRDFL
ncbi:hypothetical protein G3N95_01765 [Paraburkholderia sp. Tr-20389]|uniref:hypothetical protein n=1 Tax=Paraburkholderia sp. Tr-20389 TaxID=2703903 RepID=UPI0019817BC3|nr:hypothetical protein [Paraburkholderia sp. Tr-20389]MBN3751648.1 hypothetical protein [Paraburkholderia sp. Tr-20389]